MRIRCAKCDKPVDWMEIIQEPGHGGRKIIAHCHGDQDAMSMPLQFLAGLSREEMQQLADNEGIAFATDRIAAA